MKKYSKPRIIKFKTREEMIKEEIIERIKGKKFPRGERKWCIKCANNICKFIKKLNVSISI